jgi:hypothetical protein
LAASSVEGVRVNSVSIQANGDSNGSPGSPFQNLKVTVNNVQFGLTQGTVASGTVYTFSGTPFTVPAGGMVDVNVYADVLSSFPINTTVSPAAILTGLSGVGAISSGAITIANQVPGQDITTPLPPKPPAITVSLDSSNPAAAQVVMGSTGNSLAAFRFTETSNVENVKVTDLTVTDTVSPGAKAAFSNLSLYNGSTLLGTAASAVASGANTYTYGFHFAHPCGHSASELAYGAPQG